MYLKVTVYPEAYGPRHGIERHEMFELDDDFLEWPQAAQEREIDNLRQEAVFGYVETNEQILPGDFEEDEDY